MLITAQQWHFDSGALPLHKAAMDGSSFFWTLVGDEARIGLKAATREKRVRKAGFGQGTLPPRPLSGPVDSLKNRGHKEECLQAVSCPHLARHHFQLRDAWAHLALHVPTQPGRGMQ